MQHKNTSLNTLKPTTQLHHLYPDIEQQLCSRHSTLFGKLKQTFNKLYDDMQPSNYVIVKGNCQFVEQGLTQVGLSMAMENGLISLVSKTYSMSQIYVNSNHFSEEVIFTHKGYVQQGLHSWTNEMEEIINLATSKIHQQQLNGGILYIHANIPEGEFNYKQSFYIALYLSVLAINQYLQNITIDQMVQDITSLGFVGKKEQVERVFKGYRNRQFNLTLPDMLSLKGRLLEEIDLDEVGNIQDMVEQCEELQKQLKLNNSKKCIPLHEHHSNQQNISQPQKTHLNLTMSKQYKLLFCKLDIARDDVEYQLHRREELMKRKQQLLNQLRQKYHINGLFELFHKMQVEVKLQDIIFQSVHQRVYQPKSMQELQCMEQDQILHQPNRLIQKLLHQTQLVSDFTNEKLNIQQLINQIWQINSKDLKLHSQEVVQLVQDMKQVLEINSCMIVNRNFLLIVVNKNQFTELLCQVKHKMNRGQLKSKSFFRIDDQELLQQRWPSDKAIGQKIFSSVPAQGVGIFNPSEAIWFD